MPHLLKLCLAIAVATHPFAASAQTAPASTTVPALTAAQIDAVVKQYYKPDEPGAVVLVAKNGKTIFRKAYGLADGRIDLRGGQRGRGDRRRRLRAGGERVEGDGDDKTDLQHVRHGDGLLGW